MLGHDIGQSTVSRYMKRTGVPRRSQGWMTFIRNTMQVTAACDFFVVPTVTFKLLYGFVVLSHDLRRILHVGVTAHPTAEWTAQQLREAFPGDGTEPRFLLRDNDAIYGETFEECVRGMGLTQLLTAHKSPWQTPYVERVIGTLRRECLDHILPMGERHLLRTLVSYRDYYNTCRTHQSLDGDTPVSRPAECEPAFDLVSEPVLGGLHNRYRRAG